jgi:hypothetical protein
MNIFLDMHQYGKIAQANQAAGEAKSKADALEFRLREVERKTDRLSLACQALWELLKERTQLTEQDVFALMEQIDLRDGRLDGKISGRAIPCSACGQTVNTRHPVCIYCGHRTLTGQIV